MQRLINAIDKATRAGVYTLEETAGILQAIDQVGAVVADFNKKQAEAQAEAEKGPAGKVEEKSGPKEKPGK